MNRKLIFLLLHGLSLNASECENFSPYFAPYDGPGPISLENRIHGYPWHHHNSGKYHHVALEDIGDSSHPWSNLNTKKHNYVRRAWLGWSYSFNGYMRIKNNFFIKQDIYVGVASSHIRRVGFELQFGKYWPAKGALRFGWMFEGIGLGGDFWLM